MDYKYKILKIEELYSGFYKLQKYTYQYSQFDGTMSSPVERELFCRKNCVGVIPYDPVNDEIILIEQIRLGALASNDHPWTLEIIAGIIEPGEDKEKTTLREALEEAGCVIHKLIPIHEYYMTPGGSNEKFALYCGLTNSHNSNNNSIHGLLEEDEDIKIHIYKLDEALDLLHNNKIVNASTIVALQWLELNKTKIQNNSI